MNGYERIRKHCEWLSAIGMPTDRVARFEAQMVCTWSRWERERQAEAVLIAAGATVAAEQLGCARRTVYYRAESARKRNRVAQMPL